MSENIDENKLIAEASNTDENQPVTEDAPTAQESTEQSVNEDTKPVEEAPKTPDDRQTVQDQDTNKVEAINEASETVTSKEDEKKKAILESQSINDDIEIVESSPSPEEPVQEKKTEKKPLIDPAWDEIKPGFQGFWQWRIMVEQKISKFSKSRPKKTTLTNQQNVTLSFIFYKNIFLAIASGPSSKRSVWKVFQRGCVHHLLLHSLWRIRWNGHQGLCTKVSPKFQMSTRLQTSE